MNIKMSANVLRLIYFLGCLVIGLTAGTLFTALVAKIVFCIAFYIAWSVIMLPAIERAE